mgnify:CR=1 FL=1
MHVSASNRDILPENYWNLHRNTLFFSLVLLAFSINGVSISNYSLYSGINFDKNLTPTISLILMIVSVYAIVAYIVEFFKDFVPIFAEDNSSINSTKEFIERSISSYGSTASNLEQLVLNLNENLIQVSNSVKDALNNVPVHQLSTPNEISAFLNEFSSKRHSKMLEFLTDDNGIAEVELKFAARPEARYVDKLNYHLPMLLSKANSYFNRSDREILSAYIKSGIKNDLAIFSNGLISISTEIENIKKQILLTSITEQQFRKSVKPLVNAINSSNYFEKFRLYFIHLGAPITLFITAICHFIGKYIYVIINFDLHRFSELFMKQVI